MTIHNSLAELIGNTPLVKLNHIPQAAGVKATIAVKVEYFNPGGSSKDRIAERIIDAAEQSGQLKPGGVIVEPTSATPASPGPGRPAARLPHDFHPAGQGLRIQARGAARLRCRSHRHTDRRRPGQPALLLPGQAPNDWRRDSRRLPPEPERQPERPAEPLLHHRPRDLGGYGPQGHALRGRHWHRRHHLRHRQVPQGSLQRHGQGHRLRPGRLHLLRFLTRRSPPVRHRGRGGGLLPQGFRPEHHRRHRARVRRRSL